MGNGGRRGGAGRCRPVADFVAGGVAMVGGDLSFAGFDGIARWHGTPIEAILPVAISPHDDRVEVAAGFRVEVVDPAHPIVAGLDWEHASFTLCGYNRVRPKPAAAVLARHGDDPILVTGTHGRGRTAAFTSDFAAHWAGDFVRWPGYATFWAQMLGWLARPQDDEGG